jgi:hypothetical protein
MLANPSRYQDSWVAGDIPPDLHDTLLDGEDLVKFLPLVQHLSNLADQPKKYRKIWGNNATLTAAANHFNLAMHILKGPSQRELMWVQVPSDVVFDVIVCDVN